MNHRTQAYLQIHVAVFLFGLTAILGKLISLSATMIVWWRVLITSISLAVILLLFTGTSLIIKKKDFVFILIGCLVALHWITFYGSIKLSNASITLVCMSTTSLFTSLLEPLILRKKIFWVEVGLGLIIIPAILFITENIEASYMIGVFIGILSAFLASLFATLNKKYIKRADPIFISFIEMSSALLFITLLLPFIIGEIGVDGFLPQSTSDWIYLFILSLLCTTLAYVLSVAALRYLSAFASNLVVNLEPVYGIVLAIVILNEHQDLNLNFYLGAAIILVSILTYPYLNKRYKSS